jgi:hypothetical protein
MTIRSLITLIACTATALACSAGGNGASSGTPTGADGGAGDSGTTGGIAVASCSQTVTCLGDCADNDAVCTKKCETKTSPRAEPLVTALFECANANSCTDSACVQSKCAAQLSACNADTPVEPPPPPPGPGTLPASLVGKWSSVNSISGAQYFFNANGTYEYILVYEASGNCVATKGFTAFVDGNAAVAGNTLTLTPTKGHTDSKDCSDKVTRQLTSPKVRIFTWSIQSGELILNESDGTQSTYKPG